MTGSVQLLNAIPPIQEASRNQALMKGRRDLVFPSSTLANSEKLQSSYLLHIHCFVAEICLL